MNEPNATAHQQLVVLGLELALVLGLVVVADSAPGWGPAAVVLMLLLWGLFLFRHADTLVGLLNPTAPAPAGAGGGGGALTP